MIVKENRSAGSTPLVSEEAGNPQGRVRRARGLVQEVVDAFAVDIRERRIEAGAKLPTESEIMARFGVSRTVVREAISKLQASNLVETRHGIGTFALEPPSLDNFKIAEEYLSTIADVISLLELRMSLETEAAGLAAQRRTDANLAAMAAVLETFKTSIHQGADGVAADFGFHMEVARATGNRHYADLMNYLGTMIIPRTRLKAALNGPEGHAPYLMRVHGEHEAIYHAIRNQDAEAARAAMRMHLANSRERLRKHQPPQS
jgi:GntR family transcriptional repressor for pyruvate dehydrogenase complex